MQEPLLQVKGLRVEFRHADIEAHVLNGVSFEIERGEIYLGLLLRSWKS